MSGAEAAPSDAAEEAVIVAAKAGDQAAFTALVERYRRELHVHCYRMLGSFEDAEDMVQETLLRAWRKRENFQGRSSFRAWLYRIATNASLDALDRRSRRPQVSQMAPRVASRPGAQPVSADIPWLQPYPDRLLDGIAPGDDEPDAVVVEKETIELAFLVAIQQLPPRQRAVLISRDVLGWSARETAALLDASVVSVNSALQRARGTLRRYLPPRRLEWAPGSDPSEEERALLRRYMDANDRGDVGALAALLREDAKFSMPPEPEWYQGREAIVNSWVEGGFGSASFGQIRSVRTRANRQPAVASYRRKPTDSDYGALALDVLRIEEGAISEITTFIPDVFPAFDLPLIWEERLDRLDDYLRELQGK